MSATNTEKTASEKLWELVDGTIEQMPGATRKDVRRLTPRGQMLRKVIENSARQIYGRTADKTYLAIAHAMRSGFRQMDIPEAKPAPSFDTK